MSDNKIQIANIIEVENLSYQFDTEEKNTKALDDISVNIKQGEFVAILGKNGSGKTTFVRHLNILLEAQSGRLFVTELDARNEKNKYPIRKNISLVFQNPENQFVSSFVNEDIAFTLENYNYSSEEISRIVSTVLEEVDMKPYEKALINNLSGGQKQRIAIAGALATTLSIVIFDEATSMLDAHARADVMTYLKKLHASGKTILMISQRIEEVLASERVLVISEGKLIKDASPKELLSDKSLLESLELPIPFAVRLYHDLKDAGMELETCPFTCEEAFELLCKFSN